MSYRHIEEVHELIKTTMDEVFSLKPKKNQLEAISHLILMSLEKIPIKPLLLCQPTGCGKSMVRDVFASSVGGITINIAPLLSLNADQNNKLKSKIKCKNVHCIHLDEYDNKSHVTKINQLLRLHPVNSSLTIIVFTSPQRLLKYNQYIETIYALMKEKTLKLISVDEIQLFTQFGLWFRVEFLKLKEVLFEKTKNKIPLLFMTASANKTMLHYFKLITSVDFDNNNVMWPNVKGMSSRQQEIIFNPSSQFHRIIRPIAKNIDNKKFIVYGNSRKQIIKKYDRLRTWLDIHIPSLDLISIVGTFKKEVKLHRTQLFLGNKIVSNTNNNDQGIDNNNIYNPQGCFATRSLGSSGWDSNLIRSVISIDFPTDILSIQQEKGRCGRYNNAVGSDNNYFVLGILKKMEYIFERILDYN